MNKKQLALCAACAGIVGFARAAKATDYSSTWNTTAGEWSDATNWINVPYEVAYPNNANGDTYEVTVDGVGVGTTELTLSEDITVSSLAFSNAALIGGSSSGAGYSVSVLGAFNNGGSNFRLSSGAILNLGGADTITGAATIDGDTNSAIDVQAGGTFTAAGTGQTTISIPLNNNGAVSVTAGTLSLQGGGSGTGIGTVASGATLAIGGSTFTSSGALDTEGNFNITGTTANVGPLTGAGTVYITGGGTSGLIAPSVNVGSLGIYFGQLNLASPGNNMVTNASLSYANITGAAPNGTTVPSNPSTLTVTGQVSIPTSINIYAGLVLDLAGTGDIGGDNIAGDSNTAVNILPGAVITHNSTGSTYFQQPLTTIEGELDVNAGSLNIFNGGEHSGTVKVASGATAEITGGFSSSASIDNTGTFVFINTPGTNTDPAVTETGHTFNGSMTVENGATLGFDSIGSGGATFFSNASTVTLGSNTSLNSVSGSTAVFNNPQTMNFGTITVAGGVTFRNSGLSVGTYNNSNYSQIETTGTVNIGTLNMTGGILRSGFEDNLNTTLSVGTFNLSGGAVGGLVIVNSYMNWTGGNVSDNYGHVIIPSGGSLYIAPGAVSITQLGEVDAYGQVYTAANADLLVGNVDASGAGANAIAANAKKFNAFVPNDMPPTNSFLNISSGVTSIGGVLGVGNDGTLTAGTAADKGTVNVSGTGEADAELILLGNTTGGAGSLNVSGTGKVNTNGVSLNDATVTSGTLTVSTDTNSSDNVDPVLNGSIVGGYRRNGQFNMNGGYASAPYMKLGVTAGNTGTFTQTAGSGSFGIMGVGNSGTLTSGSGTGMAMVSGGSIFTETLLLGSTAGGSGEMIVSGGSVTIGGGARLNDLNVDGGTVTVLAGPAPAGEDPELYEAMVGGYLTSGALNVNGGTVDSPNIKLGITGGTTGTFDESSGDVTVGTLAVGNDASITSGSGTGVADISGGTLFVTTLLLGDTNGGSGQMVVSGDANVTIGGGARLNDLTVEPGTVVTVLDQDPPADEDPELNRALVGGYATNGALDVYGGQVTTPYIKLGITTGYTGTFVQTAGTVSVGTLCVGNDVITSSGSGVGSVVISGGALSIGTLQVGSTAASPGVGTVVINGSANVSISSVANFLPGVSTLYMTGGTLTMENANLTLPSGTTTISYDGTSANKPVLHLHNSIVSGGTALSIGTATLDGGGSAVAGENVGSVSLSGVSLTLSSSATLHMALGGDPTVSGNAGVTFDQITESGGVFSAGGATLEILPLSGAKLGVAYPIIVTSTGGSIDSTTFANLSTDPSYPYAASYSVTYDTTDEQIDVTFSSVPEPAGGLGVLFGLCGLLLSRRRKADLAPA